MQGQALAQLPAKQVQLMQQRPVTPLADAVRAIRSTMVATGVLSVLINLTVLVLPLYVILVLDGVMASRNAGALVIGTLNALVFLLLFGALDYVRSRVQLKAGLRFDERLRRSLFACLLRSETSGVPVSCPQLLRDADLLRDGISRGLIATLFDALWAPLFVVLCFLLHPVLGGVALAGAVTLFSFALLMDHVTKSGVREAELLEAEASSFAASALENGDAVRGLGMGSTVIERWAGTRSAAVATHATTRKRSSAVNAASRLVRLLVLAGMLCAGAWLAIQQLISPGVMMAAAILMDRALAPVEQLVGLWRRIIALRGAYGRLDQLFLALPTQAQPTRLPTPAGKIDVENIVVLPPSGGRPVVKGVTFAINPGEIVAVVGASGSGKSSLARAIAGVWPVMQGTVRIDGADYRHWEADQLGQHIGYLPQSVELFAGSIKQNIARLTVGDDAAVVAAAKAAGAHDHILHLANGYDTQIGEAGSMLSGGTRQRIGLARALFGNPSLIVLDEPDSSLDEDGERALAVALAGMRTAGRAVFIVSDNPQILARVDKILVLSFGLTLACGPRDLVLANMRGQRVAVAASNDKPLRLTNLPG